MIKKTIVLLGFIATCLIALPQEFTNLKGKIKDQNDMPLAGVHVFITEINRGVITNELGEYNFVNIMPGTIHVKVSYTGFETQLINRMIGVEPNILNVNLTKATHDLQGVVVTAQKQEQQIKDVPISMSAISEQTLSDLSIQNLDEFSNLVPGLNIRVQSNQRPNFVIRGLTSDEVSPNAQPRVSLFMNNAPLTQASSGLLELYDMERVEVLKGPQGTTFGRGAQIGAVHFLTKMPTNDFGGYISAGLGSYSQTNMNAAINIPIIKDKFSTRMAAVYHKQDGYVKNTFGGSLSGKDTKGIRFSARYLLSEKTKIDLIYNYQKDEAPGVAFMSKQFPNTNGITDVFSYETSLDKGEALKSDKDISNLTLNIRHYFSENLFLTAISSYQRNKSYERWDGDGTAAEAIDMASNIDANLFSQELRLNYGLGTKFTGFSGINYLRENVDLNYWFSPNEQHMVHLFLIRII